MHGIWLLDHALVPMLSVWIPFLYSRELLYQGHIQSGQLAQQNVGFGHAVYTLPRDVGDR